MPAYAVAARKLSLPLLFPGSSNRTPTLQEKLSEILLLELVKTPGNESPTPSRTPIFCQGLSKIVRHELKKRRGLLGSRPGNEFLRGIVSVINRLGAKFRRKF